MTFQTSGGLSIDDHLGNSDSCNGSYSTDGLVLSFFVPIPPDDAGSNPTGILSLMMADAKPGVTAAGLATSFSLVISGRIWSADMGCTTNLVTNQRIDNGPTYKVGGSVTCASAVPEVFGRAALQVNQFAFISAATAM